MANKKHILIQNVFHMLAYAFNVLKQTNYESIAAEDFETVEDLMAAILSKGIAQQLKQGLHREYVVHGEDLSTLQGKLQLSGTLRHRMQRRLRLACEFDELSENNLYNRILKTTALYLIRHPGVAADRRRALCKHMVLFDGVDAIAPEAIRWSRIQIERHNRSYELLMNVCYFVHRGVLQTQVSGCHRMPMFDEEGMAKLYERFILAYYRRHFPEFQPRAAQVKWDLDEGNDESEVAFLPTMQTDIVLEYQGRTLIIDAKFYGRTMQSRFGNAKRYHSSNLYQIFSYVKNRDADRTGQVAGMLLYAKTDEDITPNARFSIGGNWFYVRTLDLNCDFCEIERQLAGIADEFIHFPRMLR